MRTRTCGGVATRAQILAYPNAYGKQRGFEPGQKEIDDEFRVGRASLTWHLTKDARVQAGLVQGRQHGPVREASVGQTSSANVGEEDDCRLGRGGCACCARPRQRRTNLYSHRAGATDCPRNK
jgi:hypothetical protein